MINKMFITSNMFRCCVEIPPPKNVNLTKKNKNR